MNDFPQNPDKRVANRNGRHPICVASRESRRRARGGLGGAALILAALLVLCSASTLIAETASFAFAAVEATGDALALRFDGDASCYYVIEASPELEPAHWTAAAMRLGAAEPMQWEPPAGGADRRAFRVRRRLRTAPADHDKDGLDDVAELLRGTNPLAANSDGDGLSDAWEIAHLLDPLDDGSADPGQHPDADPDADGLEFDVFCSHPQLEVRYQFGSEEYPNWVGSYNDAFLITVDGVVVSMLPDCSRNNGMLSSEHEALKCAR